jgi:serine/threonine protein kinase
MAGLEGQILGGCRIIKRLGAGGMGQVYLAEQIRLGRQVALKVVRPPRGGSEDGNAPALADAPERFKLEARAIAALEHPNILPVHEFGTENDLMYLVMPLMPDGSLFDAMRPGSPHRRLHLPLTPTQAAPIIFQAASALQYAHQHNIIHRDVKPENFLVRAGRDGALEIFLADFGLVKEYHPESNTNTLAVGTADYVAPEQIEGRPVPASDQYALGVMAYELLAGRLPFTGAVAEVALKHLRAEPPPPRQFNPAIPEGIEQVILRALRKKPQDRWPSVMEFARAYSEVLKKLEQQKRGSVSIEDEPTMHMSPASQPVISKPPVRPPADYETVKAPLPPPAPMAASSQPPPRPAPGNGAPAAAAAQTPRPQQSYQAQPYNSPATPAQSYSPPASAQQWSSPPPGNLAGSAPDWGSAPAGAARRRPLFWVFLIILGALILLGIISGVIFAAGAFGKGASGTPTPAACTPRERRNGECTSLPVLSPHVVLHIAPIQGDAPARPARLASRAHPTNT